MKIVLASGSPRRRELLSLITENFTVCPADADETLREGAPLADEVVRLSRLKAEAAQREHPDAVCIGSDTMVTIDHLPLGKPKDEQDAAEMLRRTSPLSGTKCPASNGEFRWNHGLCVTRPEPESGSGRFFALIRRV